MNQPLTERILDLLPDSTSDDAVSLAWAAVQSDAELAEVAGGTLRSRPQPTGAGPEVEDRWSAAQKTSARVELALTDRAIAAWRQKFPYRNRALGLCSSGGHQNLTGSIIEAIRDVERTVADLEQGAA